MKPFNIKLSDEHRAQLETIRKARGLRSEADAVRDLIERAADDTPKQLSPAQAARVDPFLRPGEIIIAKPAPKTKSRLKGEWKAP